MTDVGTTSQPRGPSAVQVEYLVWPLCYRSGLPDGGPERPQKLVTLKPRFRHINMPAEVSMLLSANHGPKDLIDAVIGDPAFDRHAALGLFLANPFLNADHEAKRLASTGIRWIANMPSVAQQDEEFSRQLTDIDLDISFEFDTLGRFAAAGHKIAAVVSDGQNATTALAIDPDMMIVLPRIADFAAGFPSMRQRGTAIATVREVVRARHWRGLLLCLGDKTEASHETLWPPGADGMICRSG